MELAFIVYIISVLESISTFIGFLCAGFLGMAGILSFVKGVEHNPVPYSWKMPVMFALFGLFFGGIKALLPTERQGYVIASAYAAQKIAENDNVQEIGGKVVKLLNQKLDEALGNEKKEETK